LQLDEEGNASCVNEAAFVLFLDKKKGSQPPQCPVVVESNDEMIIKTHSDCLVPLSGTQRSQRVKSFRLVGACEWGLKPTKRPQAKQ
jgi:hypothetical protein